MRSTEWIGLILALVWASDAGANGLTGTIDALQVDLTVNGAFVRLSGNPTFDGGAGCQNSWATGDIESEKFMIYIWPALMSAKSQGKQVLINVSGCLNGYPRIVLVQINAT
jgi:hypothetical protein